MNPENLALSAHCAIRVMVQVWRGRVAVLVSASCLTLTLVEKDGWDVCLDVMVQGTWKLAGGSRNVASLACLLLDFLSLRKSAQTWNTSPSL